LIVSHLPSPFLPCTSGTIKHEEFPSSRPCPPSPDRIRCLPYLQVIFAFPAPVLFRFSFPPFNFCPGMLLALSLPQSFFSGEKTRGVPDATRELPLFPFVAFPLPLVSTSGLVCFAKGNLVCKWPSPLLLTQEKRVLNDLVVLRRRCYFSCDPRMSQQPSNALVPLEGVFHGRKQVLFSLEERIDLLQSFS